MKDGLIEELRQEIEQLMLSNDLSDDQKIALLQAINIELNKGLTDGN